MKCPDPVDVLSMPFIKDFPESIDHYTNQGSEDWRNDYHSALDKK